jgi:hypothetical protein
VSGHLHVQTAIPWGKGPQYPLYRRRGGPQSLSGRCAEKKNVLPLPGFEKFLPRRIVIKTNTQRTDWRQDIDRKNNERLTKQIREYNPRGRRSVGRPRRRWGELEG